ncbi:type II secretion system protein [Massilia sp. CMS3.1]|uniref:type II secretion system protein n=1 Tax=Massilia sp. CMS3.1 TaxID=3373083 RepID=UPI003EE6C06E
MNKSIKASQGGFTLIELIVVIVILGILAATALPKFANLSGEARLASLNAAKGALGATSAMTHGKWLVTPGNSKVKVEGTELTMDTTYGYPVVTDAASAKLLAEAAGLSTTDYTVYVAGNGTTEPAVTAGSGKFAVVPNSIATTKTAAKCFVLYSAPTATNPVPVITVGASTNALAIDACE